MEPATQHTRKIVEMATRYIFLFLFHERNEAGNNTLLTLLYPSAGTDHGKNPAFKSVIIVKAGTKDRSTLL